MDYKGGIRINLIMAALLTLYYFTLKPNKYYFIVIAINLTAALIIKIMEIKSRGEESGDDAADEDGGDDAADKDGGDDAAGEDGTDREGNGEGPEVSGAEDEENDVEGE